MESNKKVSISESDGKVSFSFNECITDDFNYFKKIVSVFAAAFIDYMFHLTNREIELLYCIYTCIGSGDRNIYNNANIRKYFKPFKDKKTVQVWVPKLIEKGWIYTSDNNFYINGNFEKFNDIKKVSFFINLEHEVGR